jgi:tetratricopeptide (TPR) repeat protein
MVAAGFALALLMIATMRQVGYWRNTITYGERILAVSGDNPLARRVAHRWIGRTLYSEGRTPEAATHLEMALGLAVGYEDSLRGLLVRQPDDQETRRELAATLTREARVEDGIREYREILSRSPDDLDALNNVAWIRATHELARHRDGAEAVRLARRACALSPQSLAVLYSTLAAALAENGEFKEAVTAGHRAVALASADRQPEEAARYAKQLKEYEAGRPFHQSY